VFDKGSLKFEKFIRNGILSIFAWNFVWGYIEML